MGQGLITFNFYLARRRRSRSGAIVLKAYKVFVYVAGNTKKSRAFYRNVKHALFPILKLDGMNRGLLDGEIEMGDVEVHQRGKHVECDIVDDYAKSCKTYVLTDIEMTSSTEET